LLVLTSTHKTPQITESGLKYVVLETSGGEKTIQGKEVSVHYTGLFEDGKVFDSSVERNEPLSFILGAGK